MDRNQLTFLATAAILLLILCHSLVLSLNIQRLSSKDHEELLHHRLKNEVLQATTFSFAKHFQNHMVLQKEPVRANIYGFSPSVGETVNVELVTNTKTYTYSVKVEKGSGATVGTWIVDLDPQNADTVANISVTSQGTTLSLTDVIFGDIWVCSGQSNMVFKVNQMIDSAAELADVDYPKIRIMTVAADNESTVPLDDVIHIQRSWTKPTAATVSSFSAVCWVYGKNIHKALGYAIGLLCTAWGGTPAEAWSSHDAIAKCQNTTGTKHPELFIDTIDPVGGPSGNSVLWNSMVNPLIKLSIKGVIWYQGESDASGDRMARYKCTFTAMINDWRHKFNQASNNQTSAAFPFGFVQLAPNAGPIGHSVGFPDIRWHQTADHGYVPNPDMPNTFMSVAMDLPDFNSTYGSVHPRYKKEIGDRLSLGGLAIAYERPQVFQGPYPVKGELTSDGFKITYGSSSTLEIRNVAGFEFLCVTNTSNRYTFVNITAHDASSVTVHNACNSREHLKMVRYEWRESPCELKKCAVYEKVNGLPAPPFALQISTDKKGRYYIDFNHPVNQKYKYYNKFPQS